MKGADTRHSILQRAVDLASVEGLDGLTIGRLAQELSMSKSGLFAHFGSKEELQIATIDAARERFVEHVLRPALSEPRGYPRLQSICRCWLTYVEKRVFPGGCFFVAASFEFDSRPGVIRTHMAMLMKQWLGELQRAVEMAIEEGHFDRGIDAAQLAFEINSFFFGANFQYVLHGDRQALHRAAEAIERRLESVRRKTVRRGPAARRPTARGARGTSASSRTAGTRSGRSRVGPRG